MNIEKEINSVIEQKLNDGTLEKIVGEEFERCIKNTADRLFTSYGDIGRAIEEKITQSMLPAIERTDFTNYLTKLDVVLTEIVNQTSLQDNKKILENFKELMIEEESKTVKFSQLFEKYCEYVAEYVDTSNLEVVYEDEPIYESTRTTATFEDESTTYSDLHKGKIVFLCEDDETLNFEVEISRWDRWDKAEHWNLRPLGAVDIKTLRHMKEFEIFIHRLYRLDCNILMDEVDLEEFVHPNETPEPTYQ